MDQDLFPVEGKGWKDLAPAIPATLYKSEMLRPRRKK
jgi:hypothetical protein